MFTVIVVIALRATIHLTVPERSPLSGGYVGSDAEENLDDSFLSPVAASEASVLGAPAAAAKIPNVHLLWSRRWPT